MIGFAQKILSIILFCVYTYGLGYTLTRFLKNHSWETTIIRIGIGLGTIPVLGVLLNFVKIYIDWRIFLVLSVAVPIYDTLRLKRFKLSRPKLSSQKHALLLIVIFIFTVILYCGGSFSYPYLEDDDPWAHAAGIKYIALEKNVNPEEGLFHYINPYPPGYDITLGILHQTTPSLYWTLKFFNGLIIALGFLFFFFFVKEFTESDDKAIWSTFFLALTPCYLTHFIWAHSLVITLLYPALFCLLKLRENKNFLLAACVTLTGIFLTQPTQSIKFCVLILLLCFAYGIYKKSFSKRALWAVGLAGVLSLLWWGPIFQKIISDKSVIALREDKTMMGHTQQTSRIAKSLFNPAGGTATRAYSWDDYFFVKRPVNFNSPVGLGVFLCVFAIHGFLIHFFHIFKKITLQNQQTQIVSLTLFFWGIFILLGMNSVTWDLPIGLFAFRFWILFAILACLCAGESFFWFRNHLTISFINIFIQILIIVSVFLYSGITKCSINTSFWSAGISWKSWPEVFDYVSLRKHLKPDTKVFTFADNFLVIGFDMRADFWSPGYRKDFKYAFDMDVDTLADVCRRHNFQYLVISFKEIKRFGLKRTIEKMKALEDSTRYETVFYNRRGGAAIFKIL